jgi:restriction system protein
MAIPDFQTCMLPLLKLHSDNTEHTLSDIEASLAILFSVSDSERIQLLPSGRQSVFKNRIGWARTHLKKAGLVEIPTRGLSKITPRGLTTLTQNPPRIDIRFLSQFPEFIEFRETIKTVANEKTESNTTESVPLMSDTPEEAIELAYKGLREQLAQELLAVVISCSPAFFEQLVVDLLVKMGYGGSRQDAGERIGQTGDGGIDGIIKEDRLGLDAIFVQAKRWQGSVGRPEIQKFVGALQGQRARKGVFITTSWYTAEAIDYASRIDTKVVLLDGKALSALMIDFDIGVAASASYVVKRIDSDYFEEN